MVVPECIAQPHGRSRQAALTLPGRKTRSAFAQTEVRYKTPEIEAVLPVLGIRSTDFNFCRPIVSKWYGVPESEPK